MNGLEKRNTPCSDRSHSTKYLIDLIFELQQLRVDVNRTERYDF